MIEESSKSKEMLLVSLIDRERYEQARTICSELLLNDPENENLLYFRALIEYEDDNWIDAVEPLRRAMEIAPEDASNRQLLFQIQRKRDEYHEAEGIIIGLIRDYPEDAVYYALYSILMVETYHLEKAHALAAESLRRDPDNSTALSVSILTDIALSKSKDAQEKLGRLLIEYPESEQTARMLLVILVDRKQFKEALLIAQELFSRNPFDSDLIELIRSLRLITHVTMIPLIPFNKWGLHATIGFWIGTMLFGRLVGPHLPDKIYGIIMISILVFVVYSWVYPPILKRVLR